MIDLPLKLFPPTLLAGASIYGLVVVLWLQPLVEHRMAEKTLVPSCEKTLDHLQASMPRPQDDRQRELNAVIGLLRATGLDKLPFAREALGVATGELSRLAEGPPRLNPIARDSLCGCAVDRAFKDARWPMAIHVASLRTHTGQPIRALDHAIAAHASSGTCGPVPWKEN